MDAEEPRRRRADELDALKSIWSHPEFEVSSVAAAVVLERTGDGLRCSAALPPSYPCSSTSPRVSALEHPQLSRTAIAAVNAVLADACEARSAAAAGGEVGEVLLELFQRAFDEVDAALSRSAAEAAEGGAGKRKAVAHEFRLKRSFIWFHHIKSRAKKRWIVEWSRELGCGGLCKPGFPGAIYVEGEAHAVDELVARLKGLQWQAMVVRHEEIVSIPVSAVGDAAAAVDGVHEPHASSAAASEPLLWMRLPRVMAALAGATDGITGGAAEIGGDCGSDSEEEKAPSGADAACASPMRQCIRLLPEAALDVMARVMAAVGPSAVETFKAAILRL